MDKELIKEVMETLVDFRYKEEHEFGELRSRKELIEQGSMPECYYKLSNLLK